MPKNKKITLLHQNKNRLVDNKQSIKMCIIHLLIAILPISCFA